MIDRPIIYIWIDMYAYFKPIVLDTNSLELTSTCYELGLGRLPKWGDSAILRIFVSLGVGTYAKQNTNKMPRYAKRIIQCQGMYFKLVSFIAIGWHDQRDQRVAVSPRTSCEVVGCPCQKRWHGMGCCSSGWVDLQKNRQNVVSYAIVVICCYIWKSVIRSLIGA